MQSVTIEKHRARFPPDHYLEALRGHPKPEPSRIKRILAKRCVWLSKKIRQRAQLGEPMDLYLEELAAIVELVERMEASRRDANGRSMADHVAGSR